MLAIHVKINDTKSNSLKFQVKKASRDCRQAVNFFPFSQSHSFFVLVPLPARLYDLNCCQQILCELTKDRDMSSQTNGRKRRRYNTFRASYNPIPPKCSFRRHLQAISTQILHNKPTRSSATSVSTRADLIANQLGYMPVCFSSEQNDSYFYETHADNLVLSANACDSLMEDENHNHCVRPNEIGDVDLSFWRVSGGTRGEFVYPEEIVCTTGIKGNPMARFNSFCSTSHLVHMGRCIHASIAEEHLLQ